MEASKQNKKHAPRHIAFITEDGRTPTVPPTLLLVLSVFRCHDRTRFGNVVLIDVGLIHFCLSSGYLICCGRELSGGKCVSLGVLSYRFTGSLDCDWTFVYQTQTEHVSCCTIIVPLPREERGRGDLLRKTSSSAFRDGSFAYNTQDDVGFSNHLSFQAEEG